MPNSILALYMCLLTDLIILRALKSFSPPSKTLTTLPNVPSDIGLTSMYL